MRVLSAGDVRGVLYLDAPVSGGVKGAVAGTLAFMVGGEAEARQHAAEIRPLPGQQRTDPHRDHERHPSTINNFHST